MKRLLGISTAAIMAFSTSVAADGFYNLIGPAGDKWGEITYQGMVGRDAVWTWPNGGGSETFFFDKPGAEGDWSQGTYDGYYTAYADEGVRNPCGNLIVDAYGNKQQEWGTARIEWTGRGAFILTSWPCARANSRVQVQARYAEYALPVPVAATLSLQSDQIPVSVEDPAYTVQGLNKNPAIYLDVDFSDGTSLGDGFLKFSSDRIVFDDYSGDPDDLIKINYWNIDPDVPGRGRYAAQLTSTGNGVGTAELYVSFLDAPDVMSAVTVTVVSAIAQMKTPVSSELALQSYTLPLNRSDPAYTVSNLDLFPAIYVTARFADGTSEEFFYQKEFAANVIIDDVSGDPYDLIEVVQWAVDDSDPVAGTFAGQLTATGAGTGTANLMLSFKNAPSVTSTIEVSVVSEAN